MAVDEQMARRVALHRALADPHRLEVVAVLRRSDLTSGELAAYTGLPPNLLAFHLRVLEDVGLVQRRRSAGDARRRYVRLHAEVLRELLPPAAAPPAERVLFVCTHNAARSQIAAALWRGRTGFVGESAGSAPARAVHPLAVAVAGSRGVDLSAVTPRGFDAVDTAPDLVVSVCDRARESGLPFPDAPSVHWSIADPIAVGTPGAFARAYDQIAERIEDLAERMAA
jgi:ArsR family transcriptional regulator, arsenate/arsenite/antimonite-responsive transcriptional repressor / arsenate reductase (thioredoxin)